MASGSGSGAATWEVWVGLLVGLGIVATLGLAIFETFWG